ncbi:MAG: sugar phosphate isomerase/epimerase family protein [Polaromonas sp.]
MAKFKLAYQTNCWGPMGGDAVGVTSNTRLTYRTYADMERAIGEIGSLGYDGVEMFDANLLDYEGRFGDLRSTLERHCVEMVAVYSGGNFIYPDLLDDEIAKIERVAKAAAQVGTKYLVVGGGAQRARGIQSGDFELLARGLDQVAQAARKHGLVGQYHPHLSTIVETPEQVRKIFALTEIGFCPDTAHLRAGGADVPALLTELKDRIAYVHLKGWQVEPFRFTPLDEGDLDIAAVLKAVQAMGYQGWLATELDAWPDPKEGAKRSLEFLRRQLAA